MCVCVCARVCLCVLREDDSGGRRRGPSVVVKISCLGRMPQKGIGFGRLESLDSSKAKDKGKGKSCSSRSTFLVG